MTINGWMSTRSYFNTVTLQEKKLDFQVASLLPIAAYFSPNSGTFCDVKISSIIPIP